jgi:hypothetical protein
MAPARTDNLRQFRRYPCIICGCNGIMFLKEGSFHWDALVFYKSFFGTKRPMSMWPDCLLKGR